MLEQLTKEVKAQLYDRAKSPLFGGFALAWVAWNFRAVVVLFSDLPYRDKIAEWNAIYPGPEAWFNQALLWPSMSAILLIVAYPLPARWVFQYWYSQHKEMKKVQQRIEDDTPLTQAEALALRKTAIEDQAAMHKQMSELTARISEASKQHELLIKRIAAAESERDKALSRAAELEKTLVDVERKSGVLSSAAVDDMAVRLGNWTPATPTTKVSLETLVSAVPDDVRNRLAGDLKVGLSDQTIIGVFLALVAAGGEQIEVAQLSARTGANRIDIKHALDRFMDSGITQQGGDGAYRLSPHGRRLAVENGLTTILPSINLSPVP